MKNIITVLLLCCLAACSAKESLTATEDQPRVVIAGGQAQDILWINNQRLGQLQQFQGDNKSAIPVTPGSHTIKVVRDDQVIYYKSIYVDGNLTKIIDVD